MHVLYIIGQGEGGLPHYTAELANSVAAHHEVTVLKPTTTTADEMFDDRVRVEEPFESIDISMSKLYNGDTDLLQALAGLYSYTNLKQIEEIDADIVHEATALFPHTKLFTWYHGIDQSQPFVVTRHEVPKNRFSLSRPPVFLEYLLLSLIPELDVDLYIVHTENQRDALDSHKEEGTKINVIPHGAYSVFGDHTDLDVKPEQNTILFFGNLVPPKGIDTFIEAIPHVARSIPDVTAVIAGDGSIPTESRRVIEAHPDNFEVHNHFIPNGEVKHFFGRAQVLALPYRSQAGTKGHSGVLSSAFSFGKPVVASSAGVFPQYVEAAGTGYVVPPDDPEALSRALTQILRNDDERNTMATRCLEMADQLSWDRIAEKHIDQYESLLETNRDSSPPTEAQYLEAHDE